MPVRPLNQYEQTPMSVDATQLMMRLTMAPFDEKECAAILADICGQFVPKVFIKRLRSCGLIVANMQDDIERAEKEGKELPAVNFDPNLFIFLIASGQIRSPGESTLYTHALYHDYRNRFGDSTTDVYGISELCYLFPAGFPDESNKTACWDAQKGVRGENLLDSPAFLETPDR